MKPVTVYTTNYCPYCIRAKDLLKRKGVAYQEINVEDDAARTAMVQKAGGRQTVPQIFIGDTHIGGFDDMNALEKAGKLDGMLQN